MTQQHKHSDYAVFGERAIPVSRLKQFIKDGSTFATTRGRVQMDVTNNRVIHLPENRKRTDRPEI